MLQYTKRIHNMREIEFLYENRIKNSKFLNRKQYINNPKTIVFGGPSSGKTALLCEYLSKFKESESLYISLKDLRIDQAQILTKLTDFLNKNHSIKALCIDDLTQISDIKQIRFLANNTQLECFLIGSRINNIKLDGFDFIRLNYLDYEEFLAFFPKIYEAQSGFSHFLVRGGSLENIFCDSSELISKIQNRLKTNLNELSISILLQCAKKCGEECSVLELYKELKEKIKISKNKLYEIFYLLLQSNYITQIPRFNEPNAAKKLFFNDFAVRDALSLKKDFNTSFTNVVFCELAKVHDEIFYTKEFDFLLPKKRVAIICIPFTQPEILLLKFKKLHKALKQLGIIKLEIITVSNASSVSIEGIKCEIIPFYRWALGL